MRFFYIFVLNKKTNYMQGILTFDITTIKENFEVHIPKLGIGTVIETNFLKSKVKIRNGNIYTIHNDSIRNYGFFIKGKFKTFEDNSILRMIRENVLFGYNIEYTDHGNYLVFNKTINRHFKLMPFFGDVFLSENTISKYNKEYGYITLQGDVYIFTNIMQEKYEITEEELPLVKSLVANIAPYGRFGIPFHIANNFADIENIGFINCKLDFKSKIISELV